MTQTILPQRVVVPVTLALDDGTSTTQDVAIKPFTFGQLPAVTKHIANLASGLTAEEVSIPGLLATGGEDILAVMAVACGKPRNWFDSVDPESGVELVAAIINVNREVFAKKLLPALSSLATAVTGKTALVA